MDRAEGESPGHLPPNVDPESDAHWRDWVSDVLLFDFAAERAAMPEPPTTTPGSPSR